LAPLQLQLLDTKHLKQLKLRAHIGLGFCLLLWFQICFAEVEIPVLRKHVTDLTATFNSEQIAVLEDKLSKFETEKGSQIAVLLVPTTQPEDIAQFGIRVAEAWKIGRNKVDDGIILLVAKNDRKVRIEVGYGLEGAVPDIIAKRIITEIITPPFKAGDYVGGINAGVDQLIKLISGEALPAPEPQNAGQATDEGLFLTLLFCGLIAGFILSSLFGRIAGGAMASIGSGLIGAWLLGLGGAAMIAGLIFFIVSVRQSGGGGWSNGGGFGGGFGGSGGGGGSSWGGGGGGDFGGGGASGSW
jgi:uncharacterized protein